MAGRWYVDLVMGARLFAHVVIWLAVIGWLWLGELAGEAAGGTADRHEIRTCLINRVRTL